MQNGAVLEKCQQFSGGMFSSCWSSLTSDCRSWSKIGILGCSRGEKRTITIVDSKLSFCSRYQLSPFNRKFQVVVHSTLKVWGNWEFITSPIFFVVNSCQSCGCSSRSWDKTPWRITRLLEMSDRVQNSCPSQAHLCIGDWSTSWPDLVSESSVFSSHQPSLNCLVPELLVSWLILRYGHVATFVSLAEVSPEQVCTGASDPHCSH